jgi:tetratricopeptide (TPR) repeat protein
MIRWLQVNIQFMPQIVLANRQRTIGLLVGAILGVSLAVVLLIGLVIMVIGKQKYENVMKQAAQYEKVKDYAKESSVLASYVDSRPPNNHRYPALLALGNARYLNQDYTGSFLTYEQAKILDYKDDIQLELGIAQSAAAVGDKQTALVSYQKLISLTPKSDYSTIADYQNRISGLGLKQ